MYATVMEIPLKSVSCSVQAPCDLRGLVGLDDNSIGFKKLDATITVESDATDEQLATLKGAVDAHCPLYAAFARSTKAPPTPAAFFRASL